MTRIASIYEFSSFGVRGEVITENSLQAHTFRSRDSHYMHDTVGPILLKGIVLTPHIPMKCHPRWPRPVQMLSIAAKVRGRGRLALS
ncbi:hypothetical protein BO79DRAFT_271237 [Aspergillus costaricaensis CBS 115574]|uniref:Uncharacterized protein n=1 Tax=Aspergillus costaricaensis CBS 115574 TaxID=1448317 RepID=A0ACD1I7U7_9EURO|nr:hypothetical protein BO79DRAFT_271237 [Aspergillus costaricaensis CBS 115574]RAK86071.1 hypothetical protein BO79DRAFT_271237 [Aspergillus costaricaensis CBS 115574]